MIQIARVDFSQHLALRKAIYNGVLLKSTNMSSRVRKYTLTDSKLFVLNIQQRVPPMASLLAVFQVGVVQAQCSGTSRFHKRRPFEC